MDSANTPEQLSRLLDDVKDAGAKRVLLVFGCPGTSSAQERGAMAAVGGPGRGAAGAGAPVWCVLLVKLRTMALLPRHPVRSSTFQPTN